LRTERDGKNAFTEVGGGKLGGAAYQGDKERFREDDKTSIEAHQLVAKERGGGDEEMEGRQKSSRKKIDKGASGKFRRTSDRLVEGKHKKENRD